MSELFAGGAVATPENVLAYARQGIADLLAVGPELTERQCVALLQEYALVNQRVREIAEAARNTVAFDARARVPVVALVQPIHSAPSWRYRVPSRAV